MRTTARFICGVWMAASLALLGTGPRASGAEPPLRATVWPRLAYAPAVVRIQAFVTPAAENRALMVMVDSEVYLRSSAIPLEGDTSPRVHHVEFRAVPAGVHRVTVALLDGKGDTRVVVHDSIRIAG